MFDTKFISHNKNTNHLAKIFKTNNELYPIKGQPLPLCFPHEQQDGPGHVAKPQRPQ